MIRSGISLVSAGGQPMDRFAPLLLDVWREVCRHGEIGEAVERLAPLLARRLPLRQLVVRRVDLARRSVETVAASDSSAAAARTALEERELEDLAAWCLRGRTLHRSAQALGREL